MHKVSKCKICKINVFFCNTYGEKFNQHCQHCKTPFVIITINGMPNGQQTRLDLYCFVSTKKKKERKEG